VWLKANADVVRAVAPETLSARSSYPTAVQRAAGQSVRSRRRRARNLTHHSLPDVPGNGTCVPDVAESRVVHAASGPLGLARRL